jgi:nucleoside-diphosphate kinase
VAYVPAEEIPLNLEIKGEKNMEKTLVLFKPDTIQRGLAGQVLARFEAKGFQICALKFLHMKRETAAELYKPHVGKSFYEPTVDYITSGPIMAVVLSGNKTIEQVRLMMGKTNPQQADPGSIRGDYGQRIDRNCIHGSDSPESAEREIPIFFKPDEIVDYEASFTSWV